MGADIHFFTERKTKENNYEGPRDFVEERDRLIGEVIEDKEPVEKWVTADKWSFDNSDPEYPYWNNMGLYSSRNYFVFTVLANVRGDYVEPIDYPRGIPNDASSSYKYMCEQWEGDAHSHSYFTLEELLNTDWDYYTKGENREYNGWLSEFFETMEKMKEIDTDPSKVRCCFFFDN